MLKSVFAVRGGGGQNFADMPPKNVFFIDAFPYPSIHLLPFLTADHKVAKFLNFLSWWVWSFNFFSQAKAFT